MTLWLSRQQNGLYMITYYKPILSKVGESLIEDFYLTPGEPIGVRNLCSKILNLVGITSLKRLKTVKIELYGNIGEVDESNTDTDI